MTEKQFINLHKDCRVIKNTQTDETATYYDTEDGLMFLKWLNNLSDENKQLKKLLECNREEANDYCEELMGKDEFIRLYKRLIDEVIEENEQLKKIIQKYYDTTNSNGKQLISDLVDCFEMEGLNVTWMNTEKDKSCGHCKYFQIDGMFGMWCDKGRNWKNTDAEYCSDYER